MEKEPILIIGAGIGGLSAAIRLAAAGQRVIIMEKNDAVGGTTHPFGGIPMVTLSGKVVADWING
jgi:phytoene dehydrogenase-like protein